MFDRFVALIGDILEPVMLFFYGIVGNYALAILIFTVFTKIILIPLTVLIHLNSIKMIKMLPELNFIKAEYCGDKDKLSEEQLELYKKYDYHPLLGLIPLFVQIILLMGVIDVVYRQLTGGMTIWGFNMLVIPYEDGGKYWIWVLIASVSQLVMCLIQNKFNVLQAEQTKLSKWGTLIGTVGLITYLGSFVRVAVLVYWVCGNITAVLQLFILNKVINPKKYIDYEQLEKSKEMLNKVKKRNSEINKQFFAKDDNKKRERGDYKRFYKDYDKQIVFYAEGKGFYKYFKSTIEYILNNSDICIHYVTADPNDELLTKENEKFKVYYIGRRKIISFMMKMDANVVVLSTPGLNQNYIKKSMIRDDIKYVYLPHSVDDGNLTLKTNSLEHFDVVLCPSQLSIDEYRAIEELYGSKKKELVPWGSSIVDDMILDYSKGHTAGDGKISVLIAPSWQDDNLIDICIEPLLDALLKTGYEIILRPHPQYVRYEMERLRMIEEKYSSFNNFVLQTDFSSNSTVYDADVLVTDWSGIAFEYSYSTMKPTLFVDTPMKEMNKDWRKINIEPLRIMARNEIGKLVKIDELESATTFVIDLVEHRKDYEEKIKAFRSTYLFNIGKSGEVSGKFLINLAHGVDENKPEYLKYLTKKES